MKTLPLKITLPRILWSLAAYLTLVILSIAYYITIQFIRPITLKPEKQDKIEKKYESLLGKGARPVDFVTSDGIALKGLLRERLQAPYALLVAHGYHRTKEDNGLVLDLFPDATILLLDFRAHGQSGGNLISFGWHEQKDIAAARKFLSSLDSQNAIRVIGLGFSMGAAALIGAAKNSVGFDGLIVDSSFECFADQVDRIFAEQTHLPKILFLPLTELIFSWQAGVSMRKIDPQHWASVITVPTLVIQADKDYFIDPVCGRSIYNALQGPKELWMPNSLCHATLIKENSKAYKERVEQFIDSRIKKRSFS